MLTLMVRQIAQKTGVMQILRWTHTDGLVNRIWATGMGHYHQSEFHHKKRLSFFSQFIAPGDLVFDVGANLGQRAAIFRELGAHLVCIEPQESCVRTLRATYASDPEVVIVNKALGDSSGESEIMVSTRDHALSTMTPRWTTDGRFATQAVWDARQHVTVVTLDSLLRQHGVPRFCKIDVEGFELYVLKGLTQRIPVISFEVTSDFLVDAQQCLDRLAALGSVVFNFSWGESMQLMLPTWVRSDELLRNIDMSDKALWGDVCAKFL